MEWFYITFWCLIIVYVALPIALSRLIESCLFKTRHLTLIKIALIWFTSNILTYAFYLLVINFLIIYPSEYEMVLIHMIGLIIFLPLTLKIFLWRRFRFTQLLQLAGVYLAFFAVIACTMLGLREIMKYQEKYAYVVFANSPQQDKDSILNEFSEICKLEFPANTRVIFGHLIKGPFFSVLKVEIAREDFEEFQNTLKENYLLSYGSFSDSLSDELKLHWDGLGPKKIWKPTSSKKFKATAIYPLGIFLDISDDSKVVIYLKYCTI